MVLGCQALENRLKTKTMHLMGISQRVIMNRLSSGLYPIQGSKILLADPKTHENTHLSRS